MNPLALLLGIGLLPATASTQAVPVATALPGMAAAVENGPRKLVPFVATYEVYSDGRRLGNASMELSRLDDGNWRIDLEMKGSGLMRLAALDIRQSTVFASDGVHYRPLRQATSRRTLFSNRERTGVYDWEAGIARWTGDVKRSRRAPIPLRKGDLDALLIDLAVVRDAVPGRTLGYRNVDGGRAREQVYVVAAETEGIEIDGIGYEAVKVKRVHGNDQTEVWVAKGVPTPVRILQRENDEDNTDLRLVEYTGRTQ